MHDSAISSNWLPFAVSRVEILLSVGQSTSRWPHGGSIERPHFRRRGARKNAVERSQYSGFGSHKRFPFNLNCVKARFESASRGQRRLWPQPTDGARYENRCLRGAEPNLVREPCMSKGYWGARIVLAP